MIVKILSNFDEDAHTIKGLFSIVFIEKREKIWLSPLTKAPTPTEKSKRHRDNIKNATKNLRLHNDCKLTKDGHPTGVVKPVYERSNFPLTATAV